MPKNNEKKQQANRNRHEFLVETFFCGINGYSEKEVGNWVLVKHINGDTGEYEVAIYKKEAFKAYKDFTEKNGLFSR